VRMKVLSPIPYGSGAYVVHKMLESGIPGYEVASYNPNLSFFPPALFAKARKGHPDIVHTSPDYGVFFHRKQVPLVLTLHSFMLDPFMRRYFSLAQKIHYATDLRFFTRCSLKVASVITSVSSFTADLARKELNLSGDIRVIYNGINSSLFTPPAQKRATGPVTVLFSGNLTRNKGAHLLPRIAAKLKPGIVMKYTQGLRTKTKLADIPHLQPIGAVAYRGMPELYRQADILLFPTAREGLSLSALEAMSSGLPVVTTRSASMPELIEDGQGGFLCGLEQVDEFAEKINLLADSPSLRRQMGDFNRQRIEMSFTIETMVQNYKNLFTEVLDRGL